MIYTITFNPALDYIIRVPGYTEGAVNRTDDEKILAGGKGINVSTVLKNLGYDNTALGFVSGFTGNVIAEMLNGLGVKSDFIQIIFTVNHFFCITFICIFIIRNLMYKRLRRLRYKHYIFKFPS